MAKTFENGFPGQAHGKGNAHVITNDFDPNNTPPVDVEDPSNNPPVDPDTGSTVDVSTLLPTFPPEHFLGESEQDEEFPGHLPGFFEVV